MHTTPITITIAPKSKIPTNVLQKSGKQRV